MADRWSPGLYAPDVTAYREDDRFVVLGSRMGPAGASTVELPDGSTWQVDHARPEVLVALEVDGTDPAGTPLLVTAFGGDGALEVVDRVVDGPPMAAPDVDALVGDQLFQSGPSSPRMARDGNATAIGQLVVLHDVATEPSLHPLARIASAAEFVLAHPDTPAEDLFEPLAIELLQFADRRSGDVDDSDLAVLDPRVAGELGQVLRQAATWPGVGRFPKGLMGLSMRAERLGRRPAELLDSRAGPASWAPEAELAERGPVFAAAMRTTVPDEGSGRQSGPVVRRVADALVQVTVDGAADDRWMRVLRRDGLVLLGQAPLRDVRLGVSSAEVVVPPDVGTDDLAVQVVEGEDLDAASLRPVELVRAAVRAGREAARSARLGEPWEAEARWVRCARLWERAGDRDRGEMARRSAYHSARPRGLPSVADAVAEVLARSG